MERCRVAVAVLALLAVLSRSVAGIAVVLLLVGATLIVPPLR